MKWTKELDDKLKELLNDGKKYNEIAIELKTTVKSVSCRSNKIGLKIIYKKEYKCKNCNKNFIDHITKNRTFCSSNCSAEYNNKKRQLSNETKEKIRNSMNLYFSKIVKKEKEKTMKKEKEKTMKKDVEKYNDIIKLEIKKEKRCKICNVLFEEKHKSICHNCRFIYYKYYRPLCEFNFNIKDLKHLFDTSLVKKYGWYSPSNKGNNLNGVSKDHIFSVKDGFLNNIDPDIIKHPANCQLLKHTENNLKKTNSSITIEELYKKIENWEGAT